MPGRARLPREPRRKRGSESVRSARFIRPARALGRARAETTQNPTPLLIALDSTHRPRSIGRGSCLAASPDLHLGGAVFRTSNCRAWLPKRDIFTRSGSAFPSGRNSHPTAAWGATSVGQAGSPNARVVWRAIAAATSHRRTRRTKHASVEQYTSPAACRPGSARSRRPTSRRSGHCRARCSDRPPDTSWRGGSLNRRPLRNGLRAVSTPRAPGNPRTAGSLRRSQADTSPGVRCIFLTFGSPASNGRRRPCRQRTRRRGPCSSRDPDTARSPHNRRRKWPRTSRRSRCICQGSDTHGSVRIPGPSRQRTLPARRCTGLGLGTSAPRGSVSLQWPRTVRPEPHRRRRLHRGSPTLPPGDDGNRRRTELEPSTCHRARRTRVVGAIIATFAVGVGERPALTAPGAAASLESARLGVPAIRIGCGNAATIAQSAMPGPAALVPRALATRRRRLRRLAGSAVWLREGPAVNLRDGGRRRYGGGLGGHRRGAARHHSPRGRQNRNGQWTCRSHAPMVPEARHAGVGLVNTLGSPPYPTGAGPGLWWECGPRRLR